jgi:hypothetical protein
MVPVKMLIYALVDMAKAPELKAPSKRFNVK